MGNAQVIKLAAHPATSSILSFEIGGVLDRCEVGLGDPVTPIPYEKLIDGVAQTGTVGGDASRLAGDAAGVLGLARQFTLARLRNADRRAALDSAVNTRQNIHFAKYANAAQVISTIRGIYGPASPASNPNMVQRLADLANQQLVELSEAYEADEMTGVVKATTSTIESSGRQADDARRKGQFFQESVGAPVPRGAHLPHTPPQPQEGVTSAAWGGYESHRFTAPAAANTVRTVGVDYEESSSTGTSTGTQSATHVDYEYRTPYLEAHARAIKAQISLNDQRFAAYMFSQNIPHLEQIFANELACTDNDVFQLQVALLRSLLTSPIQGVVTGVYKEAGEAVSAGEPVLRVEDNTAVHIVGQLVHVGPVWAGDAVTATTALAGAGAPSTTLTGQVVAARGLDTGSHWDVVVRASNLDGAGAQLLPPGCVLDPDATTIAVA